jgi:hypothetical protein
MPGLIHLLGRRYRVTGARRQEEELLVFVHNASGIVLRPTIFPGEALGEGKLRGGIVRKTPANFARMWASALLFCHFRNRL